MRYLGPIPVYFSRNYATTAAESVWALRSILGDFVAECRRSKTDLKKKKKGRPKAVVSAVLLLLQSKEGLPCI